MNFLIYLIFGGLVGWAASLVMKTDAQQGIIINVVVGIVGSMLGSWLVGFLGYGGVSGFNVQSFIVALIGAVVLIAIVKALRR
ncbi:MAG: GlsB/YeaQ/YmgE family stress response membrane protein [Candidatus Moraniibacteriota bacterium]